MLPNGTQNPPDQATSLPPISTDQPQPAVSAGALTPSGVNAGVVEQYAEKAKQMIAQYGNDPYRLGEALNQLKSDYLAQQYHVTPNNQIGS